MSDERPDGGVLQPKAIVARACNVTVRRLDQLAREGHVPAGERGRLPMLGTMMAYIRYLQTRASEGSKRLSEDARLRAAQANLRELELAEARGDLSSTETTAEVIERLQAVYFADLDALGARVSPDLIGLEARAIRLKIDEETRKVRAGIYAGLGRLVTKAKAAARPRETPET